MLEITLVYIFLLGLIIGSFINMLVVRLPAEKSIMGRSKCDRCGHALSWKDLIPVVSYIYLKGNCRYCNKSISSVNLLIEITTSALFIASWLYLGDTYVSKIIFLGIIATLIVIFFTDLRTQIIPDSTHVSLLILATGLYFFNHASFSFFLSMIISGVIVMVPIGLLFLITKGRGMGFGDVKFAFVMGYVLGWPLGLGAIYIAFVTGAIVGTYLLITGRKKMKQTIAFGPFLVLGTMAALFFSYNLLNMLFKVFHLIP